MTSDLSLPGFAFRQSACRSMAGPHSNSGKRPGNSFSGSKVVRRGGLAIGSGTAKVGPSGVKAMVARSPCSIATIKRLRIPD